MRSLEKTATSAVARLDRRRCRRPASSTWWPTPCASRATRRQRSGRRRAAADQPGQRTRSTCACRRARAWPTCRDAARRTEMEFHFALAPTRVQAILELLHRFGIVAERQAFGLRQRLEGLMTGRIDLVYERRLAAITCSTTSPTTCPTTTSDAWPGDCATASTTCSTLLYSAGPASLAALPARRGLRLRSPSRRHPLPVLPRPRPGARRLAGHPRADAAAGPGRSARRAARRPEAAHEPAATRSSAAGGCALSTMRWPRACAARDRHAGPGRWPRRRWPAARWPTATAGCRCRRCGNCCWRSPASASRRRCRRSRNG